MNIARQITSLGVRALATRNAKYIPIATGISLVTRRHRSYTQQRDTSVIENDRVALCTYENGQKVRRLLIHFFFTF